MFMVSFPHAAGLYFLLLLVSAPWWVRLIQGLVQASWWEGLVPAHWWVDLCLVPLVGRAMSSVYLEVAVSSVQL